MHKYLNQIGIKSTDCCIFNTEEIDEKRNIFFEQEKQEHSFDSRETWSLDYTSATWLYEHVQMYKEYASSVANLNFYKFDIPVLYEIPSDKLTFKNNSIIADSYFSINIENKTQLEAINLIIEYLEHYLIDRDEYKTNKYLEYAFKIYSIIILSMWW